MRIDLIPAGDNVPESLNVLIEVPIGGEPVKYEFDKASGALFVDRFLHTPMRYPANYGFVPHTLGEDGDPLDALVVARSPIIAGAVVKCRPIGVLMMEDDGGGDAKLICVSVNKVYPYYDDVQEYTDLPKIVLDQIEHFFSHYKDLEPGKWVKCQGFEGKATAERLIMESIERAKLVNYSCQHFVSPQKVLSRASDDALKSPADLAGKRVSATRGSSSEAGARKNIPNVDAVTFKDPPGAFLALQQRKVDGFVASELMLVKFKDQSASSAVPVKILEPALFVEPWGIAVRKGDDAFL